jgi:hypothetical protein
MAASEDALLAAALEESARDTAATSPPQLPLCVEIDLVDDSDAVDLGEVGASGCRTEQMGGGEACRTQTAEGEEVGGSEVVQDEEEDGGEGGEGGEEEDGDDGEGDEEEDEGDAAGEVDGRYRLQAVVTHAGPSAGAGHYVSDVRDAGGRWRRFDDSVVTPLARAPHEWPSGGYLLVYAHVSCFR